MKESLISELLVLKSNAGYYIGRIHKLHGPYSRNSDYYNTRKEAQDALDALGDDPF